MENSERNIADTKICIPVCDKVISIDSGCEYTLPDYQPEAKRILYVTANPAQPAKYISASEAEFSGNIDYIIYYVGTDGEIYSFSIISEYEFDAPIDTAYSDISDVNIMAHTDLSIENATARLIGPRKVSVKSKLKACVKGYYVATAHSLHTNKELGSSIEKLTETVSVVSPTHAVSDPIEFSEEIIPEHENLRIIGANGSVFVTDSICHNNKMDIKCEVYLTLLVTDAENTGKINTIQRRIPMNTEMEFEGISPECKCSVYGTINDIIINMLDGKIICDTSVAFIANMQKTEMLKYVKDMYSTQNSCDVTYKKYPTICGGYATNGNFSMNERILKESISYPQDTTIIDIFGVATVDGIETNKNKAVINGQVKYTLLLESDGEYTTNEIILPIRYEFENDISDLTNAHAKVSVINCKARQDAESISIDAELAVCSWAEVCNEITVASDISLGEELSKNKGELVIYYLRLEDSLWSVAKKFGVSRNVLEAKNNNTENIDYIII